MQNATRKSPTKRQIRSVIDRVDVELNNYYERMVSHVPFKLTEETVFNTMIAPEDREIVARGSKLFGYMKSNYYGTATCSIKEFPGIGPYNLFIQLEDAKYLIPNYLRGNLDAGDLGQDFIEALSPFVHEAKPIRDMFEQALRGWRKLCEICEGDMARIYFLWPTIETFAKNQNVDLAGLPRAKGLPAVEPKLREALNTATTFINTALLMPEQQARSGLRVRLTSHG